MKPLFHPALVNGPFDDPVLYIDFLFERRALLFDLGELARLSPRKLLRVSHCFVSHTHLDHFIGFDRLLRICLGRDRTVHLFGPPGFIERVRHRLAGYTWNLVENYRTDFTVVAGEPGPGGSGTVAEFHCRRGFVQERLRGEPFPAGVLLDEPAFLVRTAVLDHDIPSLAFCLEEKVHVNIMRNRLADLGLPVGPWLTELKRAVVHDEADDAVFTVAGHRMTLGELKREVLTIVPGQKIGYVTDAVYSAANASRIVDLVRGVDYLFIEATFLHEEEHQAAAKKHLTARQAGMLAREAGAARVVPFHFSPRYAGREALLRHELLQASGGH